MGSLCTLNPQGADVGAQATRGGMNRVAALHNTAASLAFFQLQLHVVILYHWARSARCVMRLASFLHTAALGSAQPLSSAGNQINLFI